jgi:hypothetical protein
MILEGETSTLYKEVVLRLRCRPYAQVSVAVDQSPERWHGIMLPVNRMKYRISFPSLRNSEFQATFKFLLSEAQAYDDRELNQHLPERGLRRFYAQLLRLDRILTEFKRKAQVPYHPGHIFAFDAEYEEWSKTCQVVGQYIPAYEGDRTLAANIEEIAKHQSMITIYCQAPPRVVEHSFIHELIHHIQFSRHVALQSETQPVEDERTMLKIAKEFIPNSWIAKRFEDTLRRQDAQ